MGRVRRTGGRERKGIRGRVQEKGFQKSHVGLIREWLVDCLVPCPHGTSIG